MSADNAIFLVKLHDKWYVHPNQLYLISSVDDGNISWDDIFNLIKEKGEVFDDRDAALERADQLDRQERTEYGIIDITN